MECRLVNVGTQPEYRWFNNGNLFVEPPPDAFSSNTQAEILDIFLTAVQEDNIYLVARLYPLVYDIPTLLHEILDKTTFMSERIIHLFFSDARVGGCWEWPVISDWKHMDPLSDTHALVYSLTRSLNDNNYNFALKIVDFLFGLPLLDENGNPVWKYLWDVTTTSMESIDYLYTTPNFNHVMLLIISNGREEFRHKFLSKIPETYLHEVLNVLNKVSSPQFADFPGNQEELEEFESTVVTDQGYNIYPEDICARKQPEYILEWRLHSTFSLEPYGTVIPEYDYQSLSDDHTKELFEEAIGVDSLFVVASLYPRASSIMTTEEKVTLLLTFHIPDRILHLLLSTNRRGGIWEWTIVKDLLHPFVDRETLYNTFTNAGLSGNMEEMRRALDLYTGEPINDFFGVPFWYSAWSTEETSFARIYASPGMSRCINFIREQGMESDFPSLFIK